MNWLQVLKEYGPVVGALVVFIVWQMTWINKLLDRNERAYMGEIHRMHERETMLLRHILGEQPSSTDMPPADALMKQAEGLSPEGT